MHRIAKGSRRQRGGGGQIVKQCAQRVHLSVARAVNGMHLMWGCLRLLTGAERDLQNHSRQQAAASSQQRRDLHTRRSLMLGHIGCGMPQPLLPAGPIGQTWGPGCPTLQRGRRHDIRRGRHPVARSLLAEPPDNDGAIITTKGKGITHKIYWLALLKPVTAAHEVQGGQGCVRLPIPGVRGERVDIVLSLL